MSEHKFQPGVTFKTCHHGMSILAVTLQSKATQEQEQHEDDKCFKLATNKTPDPVKKHTSKKPPPLPTSIGDFRQLLNQLIALTVGLFTTHNMMAQQLEALQEVVEDEEHDLLGEPAAAADLIPRLLWALITASHKYYDIVCTWEDLEPEDGNYPCVAVAQLRAYTNMLKQGMDIHIQGMLEKNKRDKKQ